MLTQYSTKGTPYYINIASDPNPGAGWGVSDPATHMTDNYFKPSYREVFEVTTANMLYSVTNNAWYGTLTGATSGRLYWDTRMQYANKTFTTTALNDGTGRLQLALHPATAPTTTSIFCISNVASGDSNAATGYHVNFYPPGTTLPVNCIVTNLYLSPVANG